LKGPLGEEEALTVFLAMAAALQHAHQMDILHRDIKPANIIVSH
jgi:serine/threonine protein kinase